MHKSHCLESPSRCTLWCPLGVACGTDMEIWIPNPGKEPTPETQPEKKTRPGRVYVEGIQSPPHRHWLTMWVKWGNSYTCCFFHQIRGSLPRDTFCTLVYAFRSVSTPIDIKNIDAFCHLRGHSKFYVDGLIHSHQKRLPEYPGSHCEGFKTPLQENRYLSLSTMWGSVCWHMSGGEKFVVSRGVG